MAAQILQRDLDKAVLVGKLHCVVKQVVDHLVDHIRVRHNVLGLQVLQPDDLYILLLDLLFKGQKNTNDLVRDVIVIGLHLEFAGLDLAHIQHGHH